MNNDGFLLFDSILSLLIFIGIVLLIPGLFYVFNVDHISQTHLEVYRHLYIMSTNYDEPDDYIRFAKEVMNKEGIPCDERLQKICR